MQLNLLNKQEKDPDLTSLFIEKIGPHGRLLKGARSKDPTKYSGEFPVLNANVMDKRGQIVWFGDVDLVGDSLKLEEIVKEYKEEFLILKDHDAKFTKGNQEYKDLKLKAAALVTPQDLYFPFDKTTKKWIKEGKI